MWFDVNTLATVTFNTRVDYMSIGFLVADLVMLVIEIDFVFSEKTDHYNILLLYTVYCIPISQ